MFTSIDDNGRQKLNLVLLSELFTFIFRNKTKGLRYSTIIMNKLPESYILQLVLYRSHFIEGWDFGPYFVTIIMSSKLSRLLVANVSH